MQRVLLEHSRQLLPQLAHLPASRTNLLDASQRVQVEPSEHLRHPVEQSRQVSPVEGMYLAAVVWHDRQLPALR